MLGSIDSWGEIYPDIKSGECGISDHMDNT